MTDEQAGGPDEPHDEPVAWYLGGGQSDGDADDEADEGADEADARDAEDARRTKRVALLGLAVAVVIAAVALVLASLVDTSHLRPPGSPRDAAQRWGDALVHGNTTSRRHLQCSGSTAGDVAALIVVQPATAHLGAVSATGDERWSVPIEIRAASGVTETTLQVTVVRRDGRYLIC